MDLILSGLILLLTVLFSLPLFKYYKRKNFIHKCIDIYPGEKYYPIIGTIRKIYFAKPEERWSIIQNRHTRFGPIVRSWIGLYPAVQIYKPEHAHILFKNSAQNFKGKNYHALRDWLGNGLLVAGGDKWKYHRKIIRPAFYVTILDKYMSIFFEHSKELLDILDGYVGKGYIDIIPYLKQVATDIIAESAMGINLNYLKNAESEYAIAIQQYMKVAIRRLNSPAGQSDFWFGLTKDGREAKKYAAYFRQINKQIINQRRAQLKKEKELYGDDYNPEKRKDMCFLDILLSYQETNHFTNEDIEAEVNTFMFGGQDTSSMLVAYTLMALGNFPDIQKRVQEEIDTVYNGDIDRPTTTDDLNQMPYLERVLKEVMRAYTVVPIIARYLSEDLVIDGNLIPKGVTLFVSLYDLHHDPESYPDPEKFDPDRFLPENVAKRHPSSYAPFSLGVRNCIGQNFGMRTAKTSVSNFMRRFNIKCQQKPEEVKKYYEIVLRPQNGLYFSFERRF